MKLSLVLTTLAVSTVAFAQSFPLRAKFPTVKPISLEEMKSFSGTVVDTRSEFEFDVVHISGCVNLPVSRPNFISELDKAVKGNKTAPIATYCNGINCDKSYIAVQKAMEAGFTNVKVFDEGIKAWAKAVPGKTTFMGKTPMPAGKLISDDQFKSHQLDAAAFGALASSDKAVVIDVRDANQKTNNPAYLAKAMNLPMDKLIAQIPTPAFKAKLNGKTLLVADHVGKQVEWLQYYLEEQGIKDYKFLKSGVDGK